MKKQDTLLLGVIVVLMAAANFIVKFFGIELDEVTEAGIALALAVIGVPVILLANRKTK
ncbi:hypothetical protein PU634_04975 [Oceanimonas pelagia]|uniref:Uncharacterized protein n=1 Tax=Oceanimonas pelagia TaxID=3028314 RepID=A0AA50KRG2_9GAMM|nr:hypothetical protein [Oceanimonas pelagia]WMC11720.1 hypothetical protein PU634_04975 [Oceanimonas pelagia]